MKKLFLVSAFLLTASAGFSKNIVPVYTSCGKVAYIDTERTTTGNTAKQVMAIEHVLCDD
jgi:hypothetical protein